MVDLSFKNRTGKRPEILSAILGADSFFYGLFDAEHYLLEAKHYENIAFDDEEVIATIKDDIYSIENLDIKVSHSGKPFLHSPATQDKGIMKYFPAFRNKEQNRDVFTAQEVVVDYGFSKKQQKFLKKVLNGNAKYFHMSTVLANAYYPFRTDKLIANIDFDKIHLLYGKDMNFVYYNQFDCKDEKDYLYFIGMAYKALNLDMNVTPLALSGKVDKNSKLFDLLYDYIRNIELENSESLKVTDYRFVGSPHYYHDLFATAQCV